MKRRCGRLFGSGLLLLVVCLAACTARYAKESHRGPVEGMTDERRAEHVASFDYVWETVRQKHWDESLNGVDWEAAREELRPRVAAAERDAEARRAMSELVERLGQSHFGIIPEETYKRYAAVQAEAEDDEEDKSETDDPEGEGVPGWTGLDARLRDGVILITGVAEGSPADQAGVRAGWTIEAIDGRDADVLIEITASVAGLARADTVLGMLVKRRLAGDVGDMVELALRDGADQRHVVGLRCVEAPGELASIGELPPMPVVIESRTLESGVGYFRLNVFFDPPRVLNRYREFLEAHADAPGIVIDMRGNVGGIILMSTGMMNYLVSERGHKLGTMKMRDALRGAFEVPIVINPRGTTYDGTVAVLVDELSISNAEILAAGLQDLKRARLFGTRTAGLVLPSTVERLPNGDGFQYAFASYVSSSGALLEGHGVVPDEEVVASPTGLLDGVDAPLAAAVAWIQSETNE